MLFSKLFKPIDTKQSASIKAIYNQGVFALSENNLPQAIAYFKQIENKHPSAAYNLGLIYLNGDGIFLPDYDKARKYLQLADELGHEKAKKSARVIGLEDELFYSLIPDPQNMDIGINLHYSLEQFIVGGQCGNLAYILANLFILWNEKFTFYSHPNLIVDEEQFKKLITEFITYEVYCIREFANDEVRGFYNISSLVHAKGDWDPLGMAMKQRTFTEYRSVAELSDYLNEHSVPFLLNSAKQTYNRNFKLEDLGVLRLMMVNYVYEYCLKKYGDEFFEINEDNDCDNDMPF